MTIPMVWLLLGASLLGLMMRVPVPPLTWVALTLLLHASRSMPLLPAVSCLWLALFLALAVGERSLIPITGPGYFAIVSFGAAISTIPFALDRIWSPRPADTLALLIFPAAWVAIEFLRSRFTPQATWGSIAYTQYGYLPLMQLSAFVGIWGITFLIAWFASTFDAAWRSGFECCAARTPVMIYVATFSVIALGGTIRLVRAPTDRTSVRTATLNRPGDLFIPGEITRISEGRVMPEEHGRVNDKLAKLHKWFLDGSRREARAGARLVVWPETNLLIFKEDEPEFLVRAQELAVEQRIYLAMGMGTIALGARLPLENKLILIDPSGRIIVSYLKSHAVAGWEAGIMKPGDGRVPVAQTSDGRMAAAICFDADFPDFIRQAGLAAADLLIVPANEWKAIKEIHFQMASFRAIENGVSLVRPASSGFSTAFDPWGRLLGVADYFAPGDRTMTAQVPIGGISTVYARTGDLFAWLCVVGVVAACFLRLAD